MQSTKLLLNLETEMGSPIMEGVMASEAGDETHSMKFHESEDVGSAVGNSSIPLSARRYLDRSRRLLIQWLDS